jgi:hypothetical protein
VWSLVGKTTTKLDSGPDNEIGPLVLGGTVLTWTNKGVTKQATLQ